MLNAVGFGISINLGNWQGDTAFGLTFSSLICTSLKIVRLGFFLVGAKIRQIHEVGQALLLISFQALNLAAFYYHFRGCWWREIVSASSEDSRCKKSSNS